jgi:hypothetical protein
VFRWKGPVDLWSDSTAIDESAATKVAVSVAATWIVIFVTLVTLGVILLKYFGFNWGNL